MPQQINLVYNIIFHEISSIETDAIWNKIIIGKSSVDIAKLIQKLNLNDWVNQGKNYIQDNDTCPFCQQETITDNFRGQLESYFDETFTESIKLIEILYQKYMQEFENLLNQLEQIELNQKYNHFS